MLSPDTNSSTIDDATNKKRLLADLSLSAENPNDDLIETTKSNSNSLQGLYVRRPVNINVPLTPRYATTIPIGPNIANQLKNNEHNSQSASNNTNSTNANQPAHKPKKKPKTK